MNGMLVALCFVLATFAIQARAHSEEHEEHHHHEEPAAAVMDTAGQSVGLQENLGSILDGSLKFKAEDGTAVSLGSFWGSPIVLIPIFFRCSVSCPLQMESVAKNALNMGIKPGNDFRIVAVSFDPEETPEDAANAKKNFVKLAGDAFPAASWTFLTGDKENVDSFLRGVGMSVIHRGPHLFTHPATVLVLTPEGKISQYLYGNTYLPAEMELALRDASKGSVGTTAKRFLDYCLNTAGDANDRTFKITVLTAGITLSFALGFIVFLMRGKRSNKGITS